MNAFPCGRVHRRSFMADMGMGFTGLALGAMLQRDGVVRAAEPPHVSASAASGLTHLAPKAKSVIWYFMLGGASHLEGFDPKPAINRYAGKTIDESPYRSAVLDSPFYRKNVRDFSGKPRELMAQLYPIQIGYQKRARAASR